MEIEFLCNDKVLLLEVNPRISGHMINLDDENNLVYIDTLIIKYIDFFQKENKKNSNRLANISKNLKQKLNKNPKLYNHAQIIIFIMKIIALIIVLIIIICFIYYIYSIVNK